MFLIFIVKNPDIPSESEPFTGFFLSLSARAWRSKSVSKIIRKGKAEPLVKKDSKTRKRKISVLLNLWMESSTHNNKLNYHITDLNSQCHYDAKDVSKFKVLSVTQVKAVSRYYVSSIICFFCCTTGLYS